MMDMIAKDIILCDCCKQSIASFKCGLCGKDTCLNCIEIPVVTRGYDNFRITFYRYDPHNNVMPVKEDYVLCRECKNKLTETKSDETRQRDTLILKEIFPILERHLIIDKL